MTTSKSSLLFTKEKFYGYLKTVPKYNHVSGLGLWLKWVFYELCTRNYVDELKLCRTERLKEYQ